MTTSAADRSYTNLMDTTYAVGFELDDSLPSKTMSAAELLVAGYLAPLTEDADRGIPPTRLCYRLTTRGLAAFKAILSGTGDLDALASDSKEVHNVGSEKSAGSPRSASDHSGG
jgi:hypothetical protein